MPYSQMDGNLPGELTSFLALGADASPAWGREGRRIDGQEFRSASLLIPLDPTKIAAGFVGQPAFELYTFGG